MMNRNDKREVIYDETYLDKSASVIGRDIEKETRLFKKLYGRFVLHFINEMERLDLEPDFVRDDTYNGVYSKHHIMYKLKCDSSGTTHLVSRDGCRAYEFLIEFDIKDSAYGIYYGCRALILKGDQEEQIEILTREWDIIKEEVRSVLNSTFENINFQPERFQPTNNANNLTFWTFWITLYPEEDIQKVGALAVRLIRNVYRNFLEKGEPGVYNTRAKVSVDTGKTRYTNAAYMEVLREIRNKEKRWVLEEFLSRGCETGLFEVDTRFERAWRVTDKINNDLFAFVLAEFCSRVQLSTTADDGKVRVPWALFTRIILSSSGGPLDDLRKAYQRFFTNDPKYDDQRLQYIDESYEIVERIFPQTSVH